MLSSGMFPYVMLATSLIFFYPDWPKKLFQKSGGTICGRLPSLAASARSFHCIYQRKPQTSQPKLTKTTRDETRSLHSQSWKFSKYHNFGTFFFIFYASIQIFLPYSHFITQVCWIKVCCFFLCIFIFKLIFIFFKFSSCHSFTQMLGCVVGCVCLCICDISAG